MKFLASADTSKQLKTLLLRAVLTLTNWIIGVLILAEDVHVAELNQEFIALTCRLQSESQCVVNEGHVSHNLLFGLVHGRDSTLSALVGAEVASFVADFAVV